MELDKECWGCGLELDKPPSSPHSRCRKYCCRGWRCLYCDELCKKLDLARADDCGTISGSSPKLLKREASDPFVKLAIKGLETVEAQGKAGREAVIEWRNGNRGPAKEILRRHAEGKKGEEAGEHFQQLAALYFLENDNASSAKAFKEATEHHPKSLDIWANKAAFEKSKPDFKQARNRLRASPKDRWQRQKTRESNLPS